MSKKNDKIDNKIEEIKIEEIKEQDENSEDNKEENFNNKIDNKIWILDIFDEIDNLLNLYIEREDRLKWLKISDILYGKESYNKILYDLDIKEFISEFLLLVKHTKNKMSAKQIDKNDQCDFDKLISLNNEKIYSKISFCIETWYIN